MIPSSQSVSNMFDIFRTFVMHLCPNQANVSACLLYSERLESLVILSGLLYDAHFFPSNNLQSQHVYKV